MADNDNVDDLITLGDQKYTQDQLNEMVGLANKYNEFKTKYDTDPDKAWSAYGKVTQENKILKEQAARATELENKLAELEARKSTQADGELTESQIQEARRAAQKLGILTTDQIDKLMEDRGFVKKSDVDQAFTSRRIMGEFEELQKKYDGKDGLPKFDQDEMVAFMERTRMTDPAMAYKARFSEEIAENRAQKILEAKYPQLVTTKAGGEDKAPKKTPVTKENMKDRLAEIFNPYSSAN